MSETASAATQLYKDEVLEIEPHGLEHIIMAERHGRPFSLFTLWFSANLVLATWVVGSISVSVFGESMPGALISLLIGNLIGAALLAALSSWGPHLGVPQMVQSRKAFGFLGNFGPGALNYLAGIGWFAVNTVYGTFALQTLVHLNYYVALAIMVVGQVALAVYGYNMIHAFERYMAILLGITFLLLGIFTFFNPHANYGAAFNPKAFVPYGGELGGFIITITLALGYFMGWMPFASDYSRYLPRETPPQRAFMFTFLGAFIPCLLLEWMGALTMSIPVSHAVAGNPASTIAYLMPGPLAGLALIAIVLGTGCANSLNIYSGAMSALVIRAERSAWTKSISLGVIFAAAVILLLNISNATLASQKQATLPGLEVVGAGIIVGLIVAIAARFPLRRWHAAVLVGLMGGILSTGGSNPLTASTEYTNFLLLLSYWIGPWVGVLMIDWYFQHHGNYDLKDVYDQNRAFRPGAIAWLVGLLVSTLFWNQAWYVGPVPSAHPQVGDLSYFVGFIVAALVYAVLSTFMRSSAPAGSKGDVSEKAAGMGS